MVDLTIIIPHFNSVATLEELIDSIPTRDDVQIIVVDDMSDEIPRDHLSNELLKRLTLLDNKTGKKGAGVCRNIGLKQAQGKWILFADADDWFMEGFFECIRGYFHSDFDMVLFNATSIERDTGKKADRHIHIKQIIENYLERPSLSSELDLRYKISVPWAKLYNRKFLETHKICFDEVIASNDVMFSIKVGHYIQKFTVSSEVIYCATRSRKNLTMQSSMKNFDARLRVFIDKYHFLKTHLDGEAFKLLNLHGWFMVIYGLRCGHGIPNALQTYRILHQNGVKMWDIRYINPLLLMRRLSGHIRKYKQTKEFMNLEDS